MKKLMIAAAIVCAAALSQAATVNWSCGKSYAPTSVTDGKAGSDLLKAVKPSEWVMTAYFYDTTGESLLGTDTVTLTVDKDGNTSAVTKDGKGTVTTWALQNGTTVSKDLTFLADETAYKAKIIIEGTTPDYTATRESALVSFSTEAAAGSADLKFGSLGDSWNKGTWSVQAVPEPTSGLLLLLGVAGLALRRRRA